MSEIGATSLAGILLRAGEHYDRYIEEVFAPALGEPSREDDARFGDEMRAFDREWREAVEASDLG